MVLGKGVLRLWRPGLRTMFWVYVCCRYLTLWTLLLLPGVRHRGTTSCGVDLLVFDVHELGGPSDL